MTLMSNVVTSVILQLQNLNIKVVQCIGNGKMIIRINKFEGKLFTLIMSRWTGCKFFSTFMSF